MKIVRQAITLIEMFEGVVLKKYTDAAGYPTIGFGHKIEDGEVMPGTIDMERAYELLQNDLQDTIAAVEGLVEVPVNDNQFSALVAFAYNLGPGALKRSSLLRLLNAGDYEGAAGEFHRWTKAGPKGNKVELKGLVRRRAAEELLFRSPVPNWAPAHALWAGKVGDEEGLEFLKANPGAIVIAVAPTVEETYGPDTQDPAADGQGVG